MAFISNTHGTGGSTSANDTKPSSDRRRSVLQTVGASATLGLLAGCMGGDDGDGDEIVSIGSPMTTSDLPIFVGQEEGILDEKDIEIDVSRENSAANAVPQLAAGDYDVAMGSPSAGVINSIHQDLGVWIVADGARSPAETPDGLQYHVHPDIYEEDATLGEMGEGMTWALNGTNNVAEFLLGRTLAAHGLTFDDIEIENIPFPQQVSALDGGSIDVAQMVGEIGAQARARGIAEFVEYVGYANPEFSISVTMLGDQFIENRPDVARRFLEAYLESVRLTFEEGYYTDEIAALAEEQLDIPPEAFNAGVPPLINENGRLHTESLMGQAEYYRCNGAIEEMPGEDDLIRTDLLDEALDNVGEVDNPLFGADWYDQLDGGAGLPMPEESNPPENDGCGGVNFLE